MIAGKIPSYTINFVLLFHRRSSENQGMDFVKPGPLVLEKGQKDRNILWILGCGWKARRYIGLISVDKETIQTFSTMSRKIFYGCIEKSELFQLIYAKNVGLHCFYRLWLADAVKLIATIESNLRVSYNNYKDQPLSKKTIANKNVLMCLVYVISVSERTEVYNRDFSEETIMSKTKLGTSIYVRTSKKMGLERMCW